MNGLQLLLWPIHFADVPSGVAWLNFMTVKVDVTALNRAFGEDNFILKAHRDDFKTERLQNRVLLPLHKETPGKVWIGFTKGISREIGLCNQQQIAFSPN